MHQLIIILLIILILTIIYLLNKNKNEYLNEIKKVGNMQNCDYNDYNIEYKCENDYECVPVRGDVKVCMKL